jgi:hypothetical protein
VADIPFPQDADHHWLSELSVRSLLNRVHFAIYDASSTDSAEFDSPADRAKQHILKLVSPVVLQELAFQLDTWYNMLPTAAGEGEELMQSNDRSDLRLLLRFHSAREVIHRPCLLQVIDAGTEKEVADSVLVNANVCIASCIAYLEAASQWLKMASSSTATFSHS